MIPRGARPLPRQSRKNAPKGPELNSKHRVGLTSPHDLISLYCFCASYQAFNMRASQETLRRFLSPHEYTALTRNEISLPHPGAWFRHLTSESTDAKSECAFLKDLNIQDPQITALPGSPQKQSTGQRSIKGCVETIALLQTKTRVFAHKAEHFTWPSRVRRGLNGRCVVASTCTAFLSSSQNNVQFCPAVYSSQSSSCGAHCPRIKRSDCQMYR